MQISIKMHSSSTPAITKFNAQPQIARAVKSRAGTFQLIEF